MSESVTCSSRAARSPRTCSMSAPSHSPVLADRSGPSPAEGCSQVLPPSRQHQPASQPKARGLHGNVLEEMWQG